jgi:glyoxylase-like metal-dependent hydrolase (beta-lactamase superfamily II)
MSRAWLVAGVGVLAAVSLVSAQGQRGGGGRGQGAGAAAPAGDALGVLPVQGNVSVIVGAGANIAVSVGEEGVLVVDTGTAENADRVVALVQRMAPPGRRLRYIINTNADIDHVGGNLKLGEIAQTVGGGNAGGGRTSIVAHENVLSRLSGPGSTITTADAWPTDTYFGKNKKELFFNGEAIILENAPAAHTDGDSLVYFRKSDVLVTGGIFTTTTFPVFDTSRGGSINGYIDALNRIIDITVPKDKQEGGTYVIPGHGRVADEADVVFYRDMATIIRDRFANWIKMGWTLQQVKAANPVLDYVSRYGATSGPWTTDQFVDAVYADLSKTMAPPPAPAGRGGRGAAPPRR